MKIMWWRKIVVNLIASFILFPVFLSVKYWGNILSGSYRYYDSNYESLWEYIYVIILHPLAYPLVPFLTFLFILIPFQLVKDYYLKKNAPLSFLKKFVILTIIVSLVIIVFGLFSNIWSIKWYENFLYLAYAFGFAIVFTPLLYLMIDRHVEK